MPDGSPWPILVVGSDPLARAGLRSLAEAAGFSVEAELSMSPGDSELPDASAALVEIGASESVDSVRALAGRLPVLVVLWAEEQARDALAAGARGVLTREALGDHLGPALHAVVLGLLVIDATLADGVLRPPPPSGAALVEPLTPRESEALSLLVEGLGNRAIAVRLGISEHTAKFHVNAILGKLGAQSRAEAVAIAVRLGLVLL